MTVVVPTDNWCLTCDEACRAHPTVCTVCGTTLAAPPAVDVGADADGDGTTAATAAALRSYLGEMRQAGQDLREVLGSLRGQVQDLEALTRNILSHQQRHWQETIPPELWNPQNDGNHDATGRPTSEKALRQIPRIVLDDKCTLFRQGTLRIDATPTTGTADGDAVRRCRLSALVGEFGPVGEHHYQAASLVVASPLTGKGGLSDETVDVVRSDPGQRRTIVFLQRGDGLTFVQKALMAQKAGAVAVVIGNNTSSPWPYVMKDTKNEAETLGLSIPVVMVKEADARAILRHHRERDVSLSCDLHITAQSHDCVVCCERLETTETVVQLPGCAHIFHEACAVAWLKSHNTCPYCRRELPTDDEEYERERRRQRRTHAVGGGGVNDSNNDGDGNGSWSEYYG